jgi:hypothetical protein
LPCSLRRDSSRRAHSIFSFNQFQNEKQNPNIFDIRDDLRCERGLRADHAAVGRFRVAVRVTDAEIYLCDAFRSCDGSSRQVSEVRYDAGADEGANNAQEPCTCIARHV